jgi:hypothetical protein
MTWHEFVIQASHDLMPSIKHNESMFSEFGHENGLALVDVL